MYNKTVWSLSSLGNNIFAGTDSSGVYISSNNGTSWIQTALNNKTIRSFTILGNFIFAGTDINGIYLSSNNGTNWIQTALNNKTVYSLISIGNNIFAGTLDNGVCFSTNLGTSWTQTTLNNKTVYSLVPSGNNIFAGTLDNGVYLSTNNGVSWVNKNQGFIIIPTVYSLLITNNYIFAGTDGQFVWRRSLTEILGVQSISSLAPNKFSLCQNHPNPFNPSTNIRYEIPRSENVRLIVYDALGREIETLVNEKQTAGTYEATFNASQYSSGVYIYKLKTEGYSETKKMILLK
jgi:hypothetical protein